jgi:hypothetical protein
MRSVTCRLRFFFSNWAVWSFVIKSSISWLCECFMSSIDLKSTRETVRMGLMLSASSRHFFWYQGAPLCPFTSQGAPCPLKKIFFLVIYDTSSIGSHLKCLKCVKTHGKTFYWP